MDGKMLQQARVALLPRSVRVLARAAPAQQRKRVQHSSALQRFQQASLSFAAALTLVQPASAIDLPELPNPFAKSETQQTREAVSEQTASLPSLSESKNPTDYTQQQVPGLNARSTKSSGPLSNVTPGKDSQGLNDVEERKPGKKGGELLTEGGAEFNPSGNR